MADFCRTRSVAAVCAADSGEQEPSDDDASNGTWASRNLSKTCKPPCLTTSARLDSDDDILARTAATYTEWGKMHLSKWNR